MDDAVKPAGGPPPQPQTPRRLFLRIKYAFVGRPNFWTGVVIFILSVITRFYKLDIPDRVTWDEAHFGKFANHYIKREFYFDVHPPLGKMMIAAAGYLTGYNGSFPFDTKGGPAYEDAKYMGMRILCAALGTCLPNLIYGTMLNLRYSWEAAVLASICVLFDTGMLSLCRYILLDAPLLFFIAASVFSYTRFTTFSGRAFHPSWWKWLVATGVSLACAFGVKWVGSLTIMLVGLGTIAELWLMLGDQKFSLATLGRHFMARALCLILLPLILYSSFFYMHFTVLTKSGTGDNTMGSAFQSTLTGNTLHNTTGPKWLALGAHFTIKAHQVSGALLHSHPDKYPKDVGPEQQQVTTYPIRDHNNNWLAKKTEEENTSEEPVEYILHGDIIRLEHVNTARNLHSHWDKAPMTPRHHQVTCYGTKEHGDSNDYWQVFIDGERASPEYVWKLRSDGGNTERYRLQLLKTRFRLVQQNLKCALCATGATLPKWGFGQGEVSCNPNTKGSGTMWELETIMDPRTDIPTMHSDEAKPSFFQILKEIHVIMAETNNKLVPKPEDNPSMPMDWPLLVKGQHFNGFEEDRVRIYLLGNPAVWLWLCIPCLVVMMGVFVVGLLVCQRLGWGPGEIFAGEKTTFNGRMIAIVREGGFLLVGYVLHFVPFFLMGRVLYYHHYFPAQLFACMIVGAVFDEIFKFATSIGIRAGLSHPRTIAKLLLLVLVAVVVGVFALFSPLSYGMTGPKKDYNYLRWKDDWHVDQ